MEECFFVAKTPQYVNDMSTSFPKQSVLSLTAERGCNNNLKTLEVEVNKTAGDFRTAVYQKLTNAVYDRIS